MIPYLDSSEEIPNLSSQPFLTEDYCGHCSKYKRCIFIKSFYDSGAAACLDCLEKILEFYKEKERKTENG